MKKITTLLCCALFGTAVQAQTALAFDPELGFQSVNIVDITCPPEFTFEALVYVNAHDTAYPPIMQFGFDAPYIGFEEGVFTLFGAVSDQAVFPTQQWKHVAVSYSSATQQAKLYINGSLEQTADNIELDLSGEGAGIGQYAISDVFNGKIDDVRLWNVVRTDNEIANNAFACLTGSEPGLYAFYTFNEGQGLITHDLTANNFDGDLTEMDPTTSWAMGGAACFTMSVEEPASVSKIAAYPNPATDQIRISGIDREQKYTIRNVLGAEVAKGTLTANQTSIPVSHLATGMYLLRLEKGKTVKFIKK